MATDSFYVEPLAEGEFEHSPYQYLTYSKCNKISIGDEVLHHTMVALQDSKSYHVFFKSSKKLFHRIPDSLPTSSKTPFDQINRFLLEKVMGYLRIPFHRSRNEKNEDNFYSAVNKYGLIYVKVKCVAEVDLKAFSLANADLFSNIYRGPKYSNESSISEVLLNFVATYFGGVTSIVIAGGVHVNSIHLIPLINNCNVLVSFKFLEGVIVDAETLMILSEEMSFWKLKISHIDHLKDFDLQKFTSNIVKRNALGLVNVGVVHLSKNKKFLYDLFEFNWEYLKKLSLDCWTLETGDLKALGNCNRLKFLTLTNCYKLDDTILNDIGILTTLDKLRLHGNKNWTETAILNCLKQLQLKELTVSDVANFGDDVLGSLGETDTLRILKLNRLYVTDVGMKNFLRPNGSLRELYIYLCPNIGHDFFKFFYKLGFHWTMQKLSFTTPDASECNKDGILAHVISLMKDKFHSYDKIVLDKE